MSELDDFLLREKASRTEKLFFSELASNSFPASATFLNRFCSKQSSQYLPASALALCLSLLLSLVGFPALYSLETSQKLSYLLFLKPAHFLLLFLLPFKRRQTSHNLDLHHSDNWLKESILPATSTLRVLASARNNNNYLVIIMLFIVIIIWVTSQRTMRERACARLHIFYRKSIKRLLRIITHDKV